MQICHFVALVKMFVIVEVMERLFSESLAILPPASPPSRVFVSLRWSTPLVKATEVKPLGVNYKQRGQVNLFVKVPFVHSGGMWVFPSTWLTTETPPYGGWDYRLQTHCLTGAYSLSYTPSHKRQPSSVIWNNNWDKTAGRRK